MRFIDENTEPCANKVLVKLHRPEEKIGNIILASETRNKMSMGQDAGEIVTLGPTAFQIDFGDEDERPQIGDIVVFEKYGGQLEKDKDDNPYRLLTDIQIRAIIERKDHGQAMARCEADDDSEEEAA